MSNLSKEEQIIQIWEQANTTVKRAQQACFKTKGAAPQYANVVAAEEQMISAQEQALLSNREKAVNEHKQNAKPGVSYMNTPNFGADMDYFDVKMQDVKIRKRTLPLGVVHCDMSDSKICVNGDGCKVK